MTTRTERGTFAPGTSGNPNGRPASVTAHLRVFRKLVTEEAVARVIDALLQAAQGGDVSAIKEFLSRVLGTATLVDLHDGLDLRDPKALIDSLTPQARDLLRSHLEESGQ